ncbi:MAG: hypothetical protein Q9226_008741, partial [Calogaya cf. arnoldii]
WLTAVKEDKNKTIVEPWIGEDDQANDDDEAWLAGAGEARTEDKKSEEEDVVVQVLRKLCRHQLKGTQCPPNCRCPANICPKYSFFRCPHTTHHEDEDGNILYHVLPTDSHIRAGRPCQHRHKQYVFGNSPL